MTEKKLRLLLESLKIPYEEETSLATYTSFRVGGRARFLAKPENEASLRELFAELGGDVPLFYLGGGSNVLISDEGFWGLVVQLHLPEKIEILEQNNDYLKVYLPASARTAWSGKKISELGYTHAEFMTTIPGTVGGALAQNAGCYGKEIKDVVETIRLLDQGEIKELSKEEASFSYRHSIFKEKNVLALGATFVFPKGDLREINKRIESYRSHRLKSQPKNRRSAGSVFKNPPGKKAWQLLDEAGLRGFTQGGAEISREHCNFIINHGQATAFDIYYLMCYAEERVWRHHGIRLEREIVLVGHFPQLVFSL
ncbi:MAG: UDP-N-acetylmuramate dehydrogenase [Leptospiraceae bacterium]|nr:UDP-N-acetylmuramate dehydrogenase [Leptospiraceae bacterium]